MYYTVPGASCNIKIIKNYLIDNAEYSLLKIAWFTKFNTFLGEEIIFVSNNVVSGWEKVSE